MTNTNNPQDKNRQDQNKTPGSLKERDRASEAGRETAKPAQDSTRSDKR